MIKDFLEIGQIVGTHGIRGEVRLNPWCDSPEFVKKFKIENEIIVPTERVNLNKLVG